MDQEQKTPSRAEAIFDGLISRAGFRILAAALLGILVWLGQKSLDKLETQGTQIGDLKTDMAVLSSQVRTGLRETADLEVRMRTQERLTRR